MARDPRGRPTGHAGPSLPLHVQADSKKSGHGRHERLGRVFDDACGDQTVDVALRHGVILFQWVELAGVYYDVGRGLVVTWFDTKISATGYDCKRIRADFFAASSRRGRAPPPPMPMGAEASPENEAEGDDSATPPPPPSG